jgi:hypothetical protein
MAQDFDEVTISANGTQLISLGSSIGPDFGEVVGGRVICRDKFGHAGVVLSGGEEEQHAALAGGAVVIRNGSLRLIDSQGKRRALIVTGDVLENTDGGVIVLDAAGDSQPGPLGSHSAIVLNSSKRSLIINGTDGNPLVELGAGGNLFLGGSNTEGDIVLRDQSGKVRVMLGNNQSLAILAPDGTAVVTLGKNGDLVLGGGNQDGDLTLRSGSKKDRITMGADEMKLVIQNDNKDKLVEIGGTNGNISVAGDISAKGNLAAGGNLTSQRITQRSRKVDQNQHYDMFSVAQNGAFVVELAASYSVLQSNTDQHFRGFGYASWTVFTFREADKDESDSWNAQGGVAFEHGTSQDLLWDTKPKLSLTGGKVRLFTGKVAFQQSGVPTVISDATLAVRALYGSLLNF